MLNVGLCNHFQAADKSDPPKSANDDVQYMNLPNARNYNHDGQKDPLVSGYIELYTMYICRSDQICKSSAKQCIEYV